MGGGGANKCISRNVELKILLACDDHHTDNYYKQKLSISRIVNSPKTVVWTSEPGGFVPAGCPWISVTSRSFCRARLFDPWPKPKLEDSHCEGLSGDILQLRQKYKQLCRHWSVFRMTRTWSPHRARGAPRSCPSSPSHIPLGADVAGLRWGERQLNLVLTQICVLSSVRAVCWSHEEVSSQVLYE